MTQAAVQVRRAVASEADVVGAALADAFNDDPVFSWLIPGDARRDARFQAYFASIARSYLRMQKHAFVAGDGRGAALWSEPGKWAMPQSEVLRETPAALKAFGRNLPRALRLLVQVEGLHPKEPKHWYLGYLGTRSDSQGQGIGSAMLRAVLDEADKERLPAYLESSNERNLTLYQRHGFQVVHELKALGSGPTIYRMWRDPQ